MTTSGPAGRPQSIVAGIGCASVATAEEIIDLLDACLAGAGLRPEQLLAIGTHERKRGSAALTAVAAHYGVPLRLLEAAGLDARHAGVCEAVAAAAGPLLLGKRKSAYATCAIALCRPGFTVDGFGQPGRSSAAMASSIVPTSWAGP